MPDARRCVLQAPGVAVTNVELAKPLTATRNGFSPNAAVACGAAERKKRERLCRYVPQPPIGLERPRRDGDGLVVHELKRPCRDGTTEFLFEPLDFLARLAALAPTFSSARYRQQWVIWAFGFTFGFTIR